MALKIAMKKEIEFTPEFDENRESPEPTKVFFKQLTNDEKIELLMAHDVLEGQKATETIKLFKDLLKQAIVKIENCSTTVIEEFLMYCDLALITELGAFAFEMIYPSGTVKNE